MRGLIGCSRHRNVAGATVVASLIAAGVMTGSAPAAGSDVTSLDLPKLYVPGVANIYSAGRYINGRPLDEPVGIELPEPQNLNRTLLFSAVDGQVDCGLGATTPDGGNCGDIGRSAIIQSYPAPVGYNFSYDGVGITGYADYDYGHFMALAGVFLTDVEEPPASELPAQRLDFTTKRDASSTAKQHDFPEVSPGLKQVFFIGDGRSTEYPLGLALRSGPTIQRFHVPPGATRLYLGFQDRNDNTNNSGRLTADVQLRLRTDEEQPPPPPDCTPLPTTSAGVASVPTAATTRVPSTTTRFTGTTGDDVIVGTPANDSILGNGGDDLICGLGGDDRLYGGGGRDAIFGGDGADHVAGEDGADLIHGGPGNDNPLNGLGGDDRIYGDAGTDVFIDGGEGSDFCSKGSANVGARSVQNCETNALVSKRARKKTRRASKNAASRR